MGAAGYDGPVSAAAGWHVGRCDGSAAGSVVRGVLWGEASVFGYRFARSLVGGSDIGEVMPGELRAGARCPKCGRLLLAVCRTVGHDRTEIEYFHQRAKGERRRRRRCRVLLTCAYVGRGYGSAFESALKGSEVQ